MSTLRRFWFTFEPFQTPTALNLGCGVTAGDYTDAVELLRKRVFRDSELPSIRKVIEDIDISTLDSRHVLPNMNPPNARGVWFPKGYSSEAGPQTER